MPAEIIERHGRDRPQSVFAIFEDGSVWTYGDLRARVARAAAGLQALGIERGSRVICWLPNGPHALLLWFALSRLGAVFVPINTAYRGDVLSRIIDNADAQLIVAHEGLVDRLGGIADRPAMRLGVVGGELGTGLPPGAFDAAEIFDFRGRPREEYAFVEPWDTQSIVYTSGTTGPAKGVLSSYLHLYAGSEGYHFLREDDRALVSLPLFHIGGQGAVYRMLVRGASIVLVEGFRTDKFWSQIASNKVTFVVLLGAMIPFLMKAPPTPADRAHTLRAAIAVPMSGNALEFGSRFGVDVYTNFSMTELSCPIFSDPNPASIGACGRVRPGFDARIVDANDCEVPVGEPGELIVRADMPWAISHGYHRNPEATAASWRNGWFHTGDGFRRDAEGNFYFVERLKDSIRRRGENISSFEVESTLMRHASIREAAVVGVPSEYGEEEVLAVVSLVPGSTLDPAALIAYLADALPYFMVPRYLRIVDELPKTASQKVQKYVLRSEGLRSDVWDREAAGLTIKRDRLSRKPSAGGAI